MGLNFAIIHDGTHEAFDLGKWCGYEWRDHVPDDRETIEAYFERFFNAYDPPAPERVKPVTDAVWAFVSARPGCRVIDENADQWWGKAPDDRVREAWRPDEIYIEVGSRYAAEDAATQRQGDGP
jgi:hypothetical protein